MSRQDDMARKYGYGMAAVGDEDLLEPRSVRLTPIGAGLIAVTIFAVGWTFGAGVVLHALTRRA